MAKKSNVRRVSDKKKNKPKVRFNIGVLIIIFSIDFKRVRQDINKQYCEK